MNVIEIGLTRYVTRWACVAPFTFEFTINVAKLADFWIKVFSCKDESTLEKVNVMAVSINATRRLLKYNVFEDVNTHFESYAFNWGSQVLRINYGPDFNPIWDVADFQYSFGICDRKPVTIGGSWYLPVLKEPPKYTIKEDLVNYSRLAMTKLSMKIINHGGELDFMNELTLFNNDVHHYRLPNDERTEYDREELQPLAGFLFEDIDIALTDGTITGNDVRNTYDVMVPVDVFTAEDYPEMKSEMIGKPIPYCSGPVKVVPAIPTNDNGTGNVSYRVARSMTSFGVIQLLSDDKWTSFTPVSTNLATGEFVMAQAVARVDGDPKKCRCVDAVGEAQTRLTDVIIALDEMANGITFNSSFYDTAEWTSEASRIIQGGFYLSKQKELYNVIKELQEGCNLRFRYEFNSSLLRTIRIDDDSREPIHYIQKEEIKENGTLRITTDRETIFAFSQVGYDKNYEAGTETTYTDSSAQAEVAKNIRQKPTLPISTFLIGEENAIARARLDASTFGKVRRFSEFTLTEEKYLTLRIYDTIIAELETANRKWMGRWKCKVLSVSPKEPETKIRVCLIERVVYDEDGHIYKVSDTGDFKVDESGDYKVAQ